VSRPSSGSTIEAQAIRALRRRKLQYERYFKNRDGRDGMDNQAQSAYISIIKTLVELTRKSADTSTDPEEWKRQAQEILRRDYGITP
jgi:hypothetical protein